MLLAAYGWDKARTLLPGRRGLLLSSNVTNPALPLETTGSETHIL